MVNVLVAGTPFGLQGQDPLERWLTDAQRQLLESIAPEVTVEHLSVRELHDGARPLRPPEVLFLESSGNEVAYESLPGLVHARALPQIITEELRWMHVCAAGVNHLVPLVPEGVTLTNASGVHSPAIAESVLAAILSHAKNFDARRENQDRGVWAALDCRELGFLNVCVIGVGHIGKHVARLCRAFDMRVTGVARTPRRLENFDVVYPPTHLARALQGADYVVIACPLTDETRGLVGSEELALLGPGSYVINVARGPILDEEALQASLAARRISGAFLDVFADEPLPTQNPLWSQPGIRVSPHDTHSSQRIGDNQVELFASNLRRYLAGEELINVIDLARGY